MKLATVAAALLFSLVSSTTHAAPPATQAASQPSTQPVSQDDKIITDDLLVVGITDLTGPGVVTPIKCRVNDKVEISVPLVPLVSVKEMTLVQAASAVAKAYRDASLIPHATVTVERIESGTNPSMRSGPVRVNDYVQVDITDLVGPGVVSSYKSQIPREGTVKLPHVGAVPIVDLSEAKAELAIQRAYRNANLIPNAQVSVRRISEADAKGK